MSHTSILRYSHGFSLVELMISITIGLILMLGLSSLLVNSSQNRTELEKSSRQIENGRYATQVLRDAITHAGFYGEYACQSDSTSPTLCAPASPPTPLTALPDPCLTTLAGLSLTRGLPLPIQGYDSTSLATAVPTCVGSANYKSGTDILVIRRANTNSTPTASIEDGKIYIQTNPFGYVIANRSGGTWSYVGTSVGSDDLNVTGAAALPLVKKDGTSADLRNYVVQIYFVSPCSIPAGGGSNCTGASDDNGKPIPTLKMVELSTEDHLPAMSAPISLVEGIDNLQMDFGIDSDNDGAPNSYTTCSSSTPCTLANWSNVVAIRANLLARNLESTAGHTDTKQYDLGLAGVTTATNDAYKRHAYSILIRANNPSGRREN